MKRDNRIFFKRDGAVARAASRDPRIAAELRAYVASLAHRKRMPTDEYGNKYRADR